MSGTLNNGEARLLYSMAQIEYIRLWLVKTGLTKDLIPLPYKACMLTASNLQNHAPVVYKTAAELKKAIKVHKSRIYPSSRNKPLTTTRKRRQNIDKNNKRLKGAADPSLHNRRLMFERVRALWAEKRGSWCAMDFEAWEYEHQTLTEFGYSFVTFENGEPKEEMGHLIVEENQYLHNRQYVKGCKDVSDLSLSLDVSSARTATS